MNSNNIKKNKTEKIDNKHSETDENSCSERKNEIFRNEENEGKKKKNLESSCNWFLNVFFCFFFPFVCRISPINDEDIYEVDKNDACEKNGKAMEKRWKKQCRIYEEKLESYRNTNTKEYYKLLKKKPSLGKILIFGFDNLQLLLGIFCFLCQFALLFVCYI